jgi:hypothetical protein
MYGKRFAYCLVLLLLSASTDVAWAAPAVQPSDGPLAGDSDEYLPAVRQQQPKRSHPTDKPVPGGPSAETVGRPAISLLSSGPALSRPSVLAGPALLYVLMSLRR